MKRNCLRMMPPFLWGFLFPTISMGQTVIDRIDQHTDIVQYDEVFALGDDAWLFSGRGNVSGGQPTDLYFITKRDDNGTLLWKYGHYLMPTSHWGNNSPIRAKQISVLSDGGVFFIGVYDECDVVTGQGAAIRLNNAGEHMWQWEFTFSDFNHIPGTHAGIFDRLADGPSINHAIASQDSIITLNDEGEVMHRWQSPELHVHCMRWENDTTLLVGAGNSVFQTLIDGTVLAVEELENTEFIIDIRRDGERVLALTDAQMAVLSNGLDFSHWIPIPDETYGFVDADDEMWLSAGGVLHRIEQDGLTQLLFTGKDAMAYHDKLVMTASSAGHHGRSGGRMKSYLLEDGATMSHEDDVELLATIDSISSSQYYSPPFGAIYTFRAHATVKVVNHSGNTLDKVLLSYFAQFGMAFCGTPGQTVIAEGLNLASGDTATIPFTDLYLVHGPMTENSIHTMELCLVAVSPNDHLDIFTDDNQWCREVTFTVPVGIDEVASAEKMKVFPNPTTGIVHLPGAQGTVLEVLDATGRRVAMSTLVSESIDLRGMGVTEGVYVLRLSDGVATFAQRVILTQP